ncbi:unnamed protein product [Tilletia controversa]|nr:hypothetical protein CF336_g974 [Tilletia laevis]KAE8264330.1 hypothetical protein A4X03_0g1026 [Tilletia caries]CAD6900907.1 unnamed protein product [Tilletia controversa]CAD6907741.1 unnamed protein product [Tilletia controversa]CAD6949257.1 unnamed protein product [Tilletia caries]
MPASAAATYDHYGLMTNGLPRLGGLEDMVESSLVQNKVILRGVHSKILKDVGDVERRMQEEIRVQLGDGGAADRAQAIIRMLKLRHELSNTIRSMETDLQAIENHSNRNLETLLVAAKAARAARAEVAASQWPQFATTSWSVRPTAYQQPGQTFNPRLDQMMPPPPYQRPPVGRWSQHIPRAMDGTHTMAPGQVNHGQPAPAVIGVSDEDSYEDSDEGEEDEEDEYGHEVYDEDFWDENGVFHRGDDPVLEDGGH